MDPRVQLYHQNNPPMYTQNSVGVNSQYNNRLNPHFKDVQQKMPVPPMQQGAAAHRTPIEFLNNIKPTNQTVVPFVRSGQQTDAKKLTEAYAPKQALSSPSKNGYKKLIMALILAVLGMLAFSSIAYSFTDHIAAGMKLDLFGKEGEPGTIAIIFHTFAYMIVVLIVVSIFGM